MTAELIATIKDLALPNVFYEESDMSQFISDVLKSKKWTSTFGVDLSSALDSCNPIL